MKKNYLLFLLLLFFVGSKNSFGQTAVLSLSECLAKLQTNVPLAKQLALQQQSSDLTTANTRTAWLPQVSLNGSAQVQSSTVEIPIKLPNIEIKSPARDQYKLFAEANQLLYDGGLLAQQMTIQQLSGALEQQRTKTDIYKLQERVIQFFYGVRLMDKQLEQVEITEKDWTAAHAKITAAYTNGTAIKSNVVALDIEKLRLEQRRTELKASRLGLLRGLGILINMDLSEKTVLSDNATSASTEKSTRPELRLFEQQRSLFDAQDKLITKKNMPRIGLFAQTGFGRPAFNFFSNDFEPFALGGVRASWGLSGFYTKKREREIVQINKQSIDIQQDMFNINQNILIAQQEEEIKKLKTLLESDAKIIALRATLKSTLQVQLDNGIATTADYIKEATAEDAARQTKVLHEVQLEQAEAQLRFLR